MHNKLDFSLLHTLRSLVGTRRAWMAVALLGAGMFIGTVGVFAAPSVVKYLTGDSSAYDTLVLKDKPVAFWSMNDTGGTVPDLTGHDHDGTFHNASQKLVQMPNGDQASSFNGSDQYVSVPSNADFSIPTTHKLTWEAWIRPDTLQFPTAKNGYINYMGKCQSYSPTCEWESRMYTTTNSQNRCNRLSAYAFNPSAGLGSGADWQPDCGMLQAGQWLHVVGEYQTGATPSECNQAYPGTLDIWVNGVKWNQSYHGTTGCMSQYSVKPTANNSPLNIGTMAKDYWFQGAIGKVAIYNYLLTQDQINAHFTTMTGAAPVGSCQATCTASTPKPIDGPKDQTPPSVAISSPIDSAVVNGVQTVTATATDNVAVQKVEFYDGTNLIGGVTSSPYILTWDTKNLPNGDHTITAKAYDTSNNTATSSGVTVIVANNIADTTPPSVPTGLTSASQTDTAIALKWGASTDNTGVAGYHIYRYGPGNTTFTVTATNLTDINLSPATSYNYTVSAFDAAGNESPQSAVVTVKTTTTAKPPAVTPTNPIQVTVTKGSTWNNGYCSSVKLTNTSKNNITSWSASFTITGHITSLWDAKSSQSGQTVTISNMSYNGKIAAGKSYNSIGFCATTSS